MRALRTDTNNLMPGNMSAKSTQDREARADIANSINARAVTADRS